MNDLRGADDERILVALSADVMSGGSSPHSTFPRANVQSGARMIFHEPRPGAADVLLRNRFRTLSLLLLLAGAPAACGRVPGQFEILQDQVPAAGCGIDTNRTIYRGEGYLDLSLVRSGAQSAYFLFPLVINNLPGSTSGSADTNEIDVHSFAVDIGTTGQSYLPPNVQTLFSTLNSKPGTADYALLHYSL